MTRGGVEETVQIVFDISSIEMLEIISLFWIWNIWCFIYKANLIEDSDFKMIRAW